MAPVGVDASVQYIKLEQRLILLAWLNDKFGFASNQELLMSTKIADEGFDSSGRSYISSLLEARGDNLNVSLADLERYDGNIREHVRAINSRRLEPVTLRYFQYLAILYTEIFLDWYFSRRIEFVSSLNALVGKRNAGRPAGDPPEAEFSESDIVKLAFWMATGSGKTLIMHLNYRQFLHYNDRPLDNILLITPNEGLSDQHLAELRDSGIPCRRFDLNESGLGFGEQNLVRVIEITKLVEEKRGGGLSVPIEAFEGNNLVFVDEGHKGSGGEAWRRFRDALGETGFTFEYSATFGQALTAAGNDQLTAEYGKAIIFDYSYRYFYSDGYGKDFRLLNLQEETAEQKTEELLLGNLLSFYEQQRVFDDQNSEIKAYNLEKPLWVFVGSSVNAVYTEDKKRRSDVLTVARFLHHVLENEGNWAVEGIRKLIEGKSGLVTSEGLDVFADKFTYLRNLSLDAPAVYQDILAKILLAPTGGALHLSDMRGNPGELGMKASGGERYFGLIYIGDTNSFKKLIDEDDSGIVLEDDSVTASLFESINDQNTGINVLVGAKKFIEGWNSWRVSNMGLLNIGQREGSEIIQLFGRGVRLRGKDYSLKRSGATDGSHPKYIGLLETLNIFAVRANYMTKFRDYLEKEGVETEGAVDFPLAVHPNTDFLDVGLVVPRVPTDRNFADETKFLLEPDPSVPQVRVDLSLKVQALASNVGGISDLVAQGGSERLIPPTSLELVDWEAAYLELLDYKESKGFVNLVIKPEVLKKVFTTSVPKNVYIIVADESAVKPELFANTTVLYEAVVSVLKKYVDQFYRMHRERWDSNHMEYKALDANDTNFQDYSVKIPRSEAGLVSAIHVLIAEGDKIYSNEELELPNIHFDRHLYQPLLIEHSGKIKSAPPGLNDSEKNFVRDLRQYYLEQKNESLAGSLVFLLRNLTRGKGIGFFENRGFYPDFILWIKTDFKQRIVFVEPHGMRLAGPYQNDHKARLFESLPKLSLEIGNRSDMKEVGLDSYIISATPYEYLSPKYDDGTWDKERFSNAHILFPERNSEYDYLKLLFEDQLV